MLPLARLNRTLSLTSDYFIYFVTGDRRATAEPRGLPNNKNDHKAQKKTVSPTHKSQLSSAGSPCWEKLALQPLQNEATAEQQQHA